MNAANGSVLTTANVTSGQNGASTCISWNTVLVKGADAAHSYVGTYWYDSDYHAEIRVYDENLNLKWLQTGLTTGKKHTLTYADGLLLTGCGDGWVDPIPRQPDGRHITAYNVANGSAAWTCDLSAYNFQVASRTCAVLQRLLLCPDATTRPRLVPPSSFVFRINASNRQAGRRFSTTGTRSTLVPPASSPTAIMFKGAIPGKTGLQCCSSPPGRTSTGWVRSAIRS